MTTKYGLLLNSLYQADTPGALTHTYNRTFRDLTFKEGVYNTDTPLECGEKDGYIPPALGPRMYGIMGARPEDFMFERIWIIPNEINAKLITATDTYTIALWNAFQRENKVFSAVSSLTPDGTAITTPTLPYNLQPTAEGQVVITIYKTGPSIQQTTYYLTIGGVIYEIPIRGLRVMALAKLLNWATEPEITYDFETSIFQSERLKEQRRSVRDIPNRTLKGEYLVQSTYGQQLLNRIQYGHDKLFAVPIIDEAMIPTTITTGGKSIIISNSTSDMWNFINLCQYIGIYEPSTNQVEIHEVDSYTANSITTTADIVETYNVNDTTIFPIFFGTIQSANISPETTEMSRVDIEYKERKVNI